MSKKIGSLPDIEDATFLACLDPLAETLAAGLPWNEFAGPGEQSRAAGQTAAFPPKPGPDRTSGAAYDDPTPPLASGALSQLPSLAAWRSQADEEFAEFRAVDRFLAATDAEIAAAWQTYPRQLLGFLERISRMQQRRALQDQAMAMMMARVHATLLQAAAQPPQPTGAVRRQWPSLV